MRRRGACIFAGSFACIVLLAAAALDAAAQEQIYMHRSPSGRASYSNEPRPGATLLMSLPPVRVRADFVMDPASGRLQRYPQRERAGTGPRDAAVMSLIEQAAQRHRLDVELLLAVIRQESGFNPMAVSHAGARGLMQLMPGTARRYGVTRIHDPGENIAGGSAYLRDLLDMFGRLDLALAAYNAGEGAVKKHGNRIPPYDETIKYVASVTAEYQRRLRAR